MDKLVLHCQRLTTLDARAIHLYGKGVGRLRVTRWSLRQAVFSSDPVTNLLNWPVMRYLITFLSLMFLLVWVLGEVQGQLIPRHRYYRFTNLEARDDASGLPTTPGIQRFGFFRAPSQGQTPLCVPREEGEWGLWAEGPSMVLSMPEGSGGGNFFDGWYIVTLSGNGTQPKDAVRFKLEGSDDPGFAHPSLVGSSAVRVHQDGMVDLVLGVADSPWERGALVSMTPDVRLLRIRRTTYYIAVMAMTSSFLFAAYTRRAHRCKSILIVGFSTLSAVRFVHGMCLLASDMTLEHGKGFFVTDFCVAAAYFCSSMILTFAQQHFEWSFLLISLSQTLSSVAVQNLFQTQYKGSLGWGSLSSWMWVLLFLSVWFSRIRFALQEFFSIRRDIQVYEEVWQRVKDAERDKIKLLFKAVRSLQRATAQRLPFQLNRMRPKGQSAALPRRLSFMRRSDAVADSSTRRRSQGSSRSLFEQRGALDGTPPGSPETSLVSLSAGQRNRIAPEEQPIIQAERRRTSVQANPHQWRRASGFGGGSVTLILSELSGYFGSSINGMEVQDERSYLEENVLQSNTLANVLKWSLSGLSHELGKPVDSIDQLHAQAFLVKDLFLDFVVQLGSRFQGKFKVKKADVDRDSDFEVAAWDGNNENRSQFELGGVKSIHSASTKSCTVYRGNVSMLLDMVRETLYFDSVEQLTKCLKGVQSDPLIEVVRVKSTFHEVAPSSSYLGNLGWAGLRFVSVNLRLAGSPEAFSLCVDTHVCELLLVLTDMGRVQTHEMRERYRQWRVARNNGPSDGSLPTIPRWLVPVLRIFTHRSTKQERRVSNISNVSEECDMHEEVGKGPQQERSQMHVEQEAPPSPMGDGLEEITREGAAEIKDEAVATGPQGSPSRSRRVSQNFFQTNERSGLLEGREAPRTELVTSWGVSLSAEVDELVKGLCHMSALGLSDFVDKRWELALDYSRSDKSHFSSIWFSKHPISGAAHRWPFQIMVLIAGFYYAYIGMQGVFARATVMGEYSFGPFKHYRLETTLTRDGSEGGSVRGPGVSDFGLLGASRCASTAPAVDGQPSFAGSLGSSFLVSFSEGRSMAGWYLVSGVANGSEPQDPAYFDVWATNDNLTIGDGSCALARADVSWWESGYGVEWCGAQWEKVGAPTWSYMKGGHPWDFRKVTIELPAERGKIQTFILPPDWEEFDPYFVISYFFASMAGVFGCFAGCISKRMPGVPNPTLFLGGGMSLMLLCQLWASIAAFERGQNHLGLEFLSRAATNVILVALCLVQGPWVLKGLAVYSALNIGSWLPLSYWYWHSVQVPSSGMVILLLLLICVCSRAWALRSYRLLTREDQRRYDLLYASLLQTEDGRGQIEHLQKVVQMVGLAWDGSNSLCRQLNHMTLSKLPRKQQADYARVPAKSILVNPMLHEVDHVFVPGRADASSTVTSINQLYTCAAIAHLLVAQRIKVWAESGDGMFILRSKAGLALEQPEFVKWNDVKGDPSMDHIHHVKMKRLGRAIEKLLRSYRHEPSRLLDISRHSIVFANISDLTRALGNIITDENVRVERLKNRLDPRHSSDETAGYRDVCLNMRVVNKQAMSLAVDMHVCEVQLILLDFAKLRTAEGHARYVLARNRAGV